MNGNDVLIKDYGCGQVRHNGRHAYYAGEHWLFGKIDAGMSIGEARADHADDWGGYANKAAVQAAREWEGRAFVRPIGGETAFEAGFGYLYRHFKMSNRLDG